MNQIVICAVETHFGKSAELCHAVMIKVSVSVSVNGFLISTSCGKEEK